jgi:hypothetical protein
MVTAIFMQWIPPVPCFSGSAAQRGLWPPHTQGFLITHNDAPQSVGILWTSDQLVAETSTWQHTTNIHAPGGIRTHDRCRRSSVMWKGIFLKFVSLFFFRKMYRCLPQAYNPIFLSTYHTPDNLCLIHMIEMRYKFLPASINHQI